MFSLNAGIVEIIYTKICEIVRFEQSTAYSRSRKMRAAFEWASKSKLWCEVSIVTRKWRAESELFGGIHRTCVTKRQKFHGTFLREILTQKTYFYPVCSFSTYSELISFSVVFVWCYVFRWVALVHSTLNAIFRKNNPTLFPLYGLVAN